MDYDPSDDGPEAWLYRRDAEAEWRWAKFTAQRVDMLLGALSHADRHRLLVPWWEVVRWRLRRK